MVESIYSTAAHGQISLLVLITMGFIAGFLSGLLGVGGGWIVTPALNFLGFSMVQAIGTGLAQISGTSLFGVLRHRKHGQADFKLGSIIGLAMISSVQGGKATLIALSQAGIADLVIRWLYVILLTSLGGFMLVESLRARHRRHKSEPAPIPHNKKQRFDLTGIGPKTYISAAQRSISWLFLVVAGVLAGYLSGLLGVGGGFILVPIFIYLLGTSTLAAVATSLICVLFASVFGTASFALSGLVDFSVAGVLLVGSLFGSYFGVWAARFAKGEGIRIIFSLLLLVIAISIILAAFGYESTGKLLVFAMAIGTTVIMMASVGISVWREKPSPRD